MPARNTFEDSRGKLITINRKGSLRLGPSQPNLTFQCVIGKFIVHDNLPAHLAQGMFAKPGSYDCIMRYSSLTPKLVPDSVPAPRGIGLKIFGVEGEKIWGEDKKTQDWTFNNYSILELRTPVATNEIAASLEKNWDDIPKFAEYLGSRDDAEVACTPATLPRQYSK